VTTREIAEQSAGATADERVDEPVVETEEVGRQHTAQTIQESATAIVTATAKALATATGIASAPAPAPASVTAVNFPFCLVLSPVGDGGAERGEKGGTNGKPPAFDDFLSTLLAIPSGTVLYDVFACPTPEAGTVTLL
jgi:hypothetical protein